MVVYLLNMFYFDVLVSLKEEDVVELCWIGILWYFDFMLKVYWDIGEDLGILDFECGVKVFGSCFLYYVGDGVKLECVVYNFFLD